MRNIFPSFRWSNAGHDAFFELVGDPFINLRARTEDYVKKGTLDGWIWKGRTLILDVHLHDRIRKLWTKMSGLRRLTRRQQKCFSFIRFIFLSTPPFSIDFLVHCGMQGYLCGGWGCYGVTRWPCKRRSSRWNGAGMLIRWSDNSWRENVCRIKADHHIISSPDLWTWSIRFQRIIVLHKSRSSKVRTICIGVRWKKNQCLLLLLLPPPPFNLFLSVSSLFVFCSNLIRHRQQACECLSIELQQHGRRKDVVKQETSCLFVLTPNYFYFQGNGLETWISLLCSVKLER